MIVLDTNVISERLLPEPNPGVILWLDAQPSDELYLCTPVLAELQYGVERLAESARKRRLQDAISEMARDVFEGRFLSFDIAAALVYGAIAAARDASGRPITPIDAMIAAIASANRASLATRNVTDFDGTGIEVINPFEVPA